MLGYKLHGAQAATADVTFSLARPPSAAVTIFTFESLEAPAVPLAAVDAVASGSAVDVRLGTEMTPGVRYRVTASGVEDVHGNAALPPFDRTTFTGFRPPRPPSRSFRLWSMLPRYNRREDRTGDLRRFVACLQEVLDLLLAEVDRFPDVFDLERAPEPFLDLILRDLGNPFPFDLDELGKRRLASVLVEMYRQKGTAAGIENAIRFFLGIDVAAIRPFAGTTLVLGESELGVDWELGPSARFTRYAFDVAVDVPLTGTERHQVRASSSTSSPPTPTSWTSSSQGPRPARPLGAGRQRGGRDQRSTLTVAAFRQRISSMAPISCSSQSR